MNHILAEEFRNVHGGSFLHIIGANMQKGVEGEGGAFTQVISIGTPRNGLRAYIIYYKGLTFAGIQTNGDLGLRFCEGLAQCMGSICSILLLHQTYKILWQLHLRLYTYHTLDGGPWVVTFELEVFVLEVEDVLHLGVDYHLGQLTRLST